MANLKCNLKNIRPREMRGLLPKNEYMVGEAEVELSLKSVIRAMNGSDVYINDKLVETFQDAVMLFEKAEEETNEEDTNTDNNTEVNDNDESNTNDINTVEEETPVDPVPDDSQDHTNNADVEVGIDEGEATI